MDQSFPAPPPSPSLDQLGTEAMYLCVAASFLGAAFLALQMGPFHLFPYRMLLILLWCIFFAEISQGSPLISSSHLRVKNYFLFLGFWFAYSICHILFIHDVAAYMRYALFLGMGFSMIFFMVYYIDTLPKLERVFIIWIATIVLLTGIGLWEIITGQHLGASRQAGTDIPAAMRHVPTGTFKMINHYATSMALSFPLALAMFSCGTKKWIRFCALLFIALMIFVINATQSRLNLVSLLLQISLAFVFFFSSARKKTMAALVLTLAIAGFVAFTPLSPEGITGTVKDTFTSAYNQIINMQGSGKVRVNLALNGLMFLKDSAGFGVGAGNYNSWVRENSYFSTSSRNHPTPVLFPHNWWIELLSEYGLIVFVFYLLFFVMLYTRVVQTYRRCDSASGKKMGQILILALSGFVISCMGPGYFTAFRTQWFLLALSLTYVAVHRKTP